MYLVLSDVGKQLARTKLFFLAALLVRGSSPFVGFLLLAELERGY